MRKSQLTILISIAVFSSFSVAGTYKWVDAQGNVHYSQEKPLKGKFTEIGAPPPPPSVIVDVNEEYARQIENKAAARRGQKSRPKTTQEKTANAELCQTSKKNLLTLQGFARVNYVNDEGVKMRMSDDEKAARLDQTKKDIEYYCE